MDTWNSKREIVNFNATIEILILGSTIENSGDALDESHMPLGWPLSIDGAVRQNCSHKKATIQALMQEQTIPANVASAHDHKTLQAAHSCLNSLRIRLEAHVNTVEQSVIQRQLSLVSTLEHGCPQTTDTQAVPLSESSVPPRFQISAHLDQPAHRSHQAGELGR